MKYFINETERKALRSTCYHEFFKGKWDKNAMIFWSNESLNIHDDLMIMLGLDKLILSIVENYNPCGPTEINVEQWKKIYIKAEKIGGNLFEAIKEINLWVEDNFNQNVVFTILDL